MSGRLLIHVCLAVFISCSGVLNNRGQVITASREVGVAAAGTQHGGQRLPDRPGGALCGFQFDHQRAASGASLWVRHCRGCLCARDLPSCGCSPWSAELVGPSSLSVIGTHILSSTDMCRYKTKAAAPIAADSLHADTTGRQM